AMRQSTTNRNAKVIASQKIWLGNVSVLNGGKPAPPFLAGTSVVVVVVSPAGMTRFREEEDERDHQAAQNCWRAKREAEEQVGRLGGGSARVAQRTREITAEHVADADTGADEGDTGKARADHFRCCDFHSPISF